jgi:hypothetical protein
MVRARGAGKSKTPPYCCTEEAHAGKGPSQKNQKGQNRQTIIINSKLMNRDKIYNYVRCNKDIAKMKWAIIR